MKTCSFLARAWGVAPSASSLLLASVLTFTSSPLWAQTSVGDYDVHHRGSVIGDDVLYSIGGGRAVSMGGAGNMQSIGVGIGWNSNLICGDMSITTTLHSHEPGALRRRQAASCLPLS